MAYRYVNIYEDTIMPCIMWSFLWPHTNELIAQYIVWVIWRILLNYFNHNLLYCYYLLFFFYHSRNCYKLSQRYLILFMVVRREKILENMPSDICPIELQSGQVHSSWGSFLFNLRVVLVFFMRLVVKMFLQFISISLIESSYLVSNVWYIWRY